MKIAISVIGKFHNFDLAREMLARNALAGIFSGYPLFKLKAEDIPVQLIHTFPYIQGPYMALGRTCIWGEKFVREWENLSKTSFDAFVARRLPQCDVFVGLSGSALNSGRAAHRLGARYICDRGSSHIRFQDRTLREEHDRWGIRFGGIDARTIEREEAEYAESDCITVPSTFALHSFIRQGIPRAKLRLLPYGVNLSRFGPVSSPDPKRFDVLFVGGLSLRKGLPYLLEAYRKLTHRAKSLTFAGVPDPALLAAMRSAGMWAEEALVKGHVPQGELSQLMSKSHVLVLPSIEEGLALVQAQAMACGCPIVASEHTGASDLFEDGREGFIVPPRDADSIAERLQQLADHPETREAMSRAALQRVRLLGGWRTYGENAVSIYRDLCDREGKQPLELEKTTRGCVR